LAGTRLPAAFAWPSTVPSVSSFGTNARLGKSPAWPIACTASISVWLATFGIVAVCGWAGAAEVVVSVAVVFATERPTTPLFASLEPAAGTCEMTVPAGFVDAT
jgi:hypothetical protein